MTRIIFLILFFVVFNVCNTHALQATFGDCSPIINADNFSKKDIQSFIEKDSPEITIEAERTVFIIKCGQYTDNPQKRLEILIFSLRKMLSMKKHLVYPAITRMKINPTQENWTELQRRTNEMLRHVDTAIEKAIEFETQILILKSQDMEKLQQQFGNLDDLSRVIPYELQLNLRQKGDAPRALSEQRWRPDLKLLRQWERDYKDVLAKLSLITDELESYLQE